VMDVRQGTVKGEGIRVHDCVYYYVLFSIEMQFLLVVLFVLEVLVCC
jgi:hypothetical protein